LYIFQPSISKENVLRHLLRLMWYIHHKLPPARLEALLEGIAPNNEVLIINMSFYLQNNNKKVKFDFCLIILDLTKGQLSYCHHFSSIVVVACKLFTFQSSFSKLHGPMGPNLVCMFIRWYFTKFLYWLEIQNGSPRQ
jgi:hypothetical protein